MNPILLPIPEELIGPRVIVRPFRPDDAEPFYAAVLESREHLAPFLPWVHLYTCVDDARVFMAQSQANWILRKDFNGGIFERETGRFLGGCGFHPHNWDLGRFEVGYWVRKSAEGKGYVTEATQLFTRMAFDVCGANRVEIRMLTHNARSKALPERLGFVYEGILRNAGPNGDNRPCDCLMYSLVPADLERISWLRS